MKTYLIAATLLLSATTAASAGTLSQKEVLAQIVGKSLSFVGENGTTGKVKHSKNGKSRLSNTNFDPKSDRGTWRMKGNQLCATWKKIRDGKEGCITLRTAGPGKYKSSNGLLLTAR